MRCARGGRSIPTNLRSTWSRWSPRREPRIIAIRRNFSSGTADLRGVKDSLDDAEDGLVEEVWASYRFVVIADSGEADGLRVIDLGSGHASSGETLGGRILAALKSESRLNDSVGASYLERNWPAAFKESGAWPLASLRKCFLDGSLTRLVDPDKVLREKLPDLVARGELGFATGQHAE